MAHFQIGYVTIAGWRPRKVPEYRQAPAIKVAQAWTSSVLGVRVVQHHQSGATSDKFLGQMVRSHVVQLLHVANDLHLFRSYHLAS